MMGANLIRVFELISKGVPILTAFLFLVYYMPLLLSLTIPFSILVATMLIFGRMSADNEITAMRACGISILQIISPIIILTFLITCGCLWLQMYVGPKFAGEGKILVKRVFVEHPIPMIKINTDNEFEDFIINVRNITSAGDLEDIQIYEFNTQKDRIVNDIRAARGKVTVDKEKQVMRTVLYNAFIQQYEKDSTMPKISSSEEVTIPFNYGEKFNRRKLTLKPKYLTLRHLFGRIILDIKRKKDTTYLEVEMNRRIALGLSPLAFLLLGMPLAIRTSRRETSVGLFPSVILGGLFYFSIIIFQTFDTKPQLYPQVLLWIPTVLYQVGGSFFIWRIARR